MVFIKDLLPHGRELRRERELRGEPRRQSLEQHDRDAELLAAVKEGEVDLVLQLIASGADVNAKDCNFNSILHFAVQARSPKIIGILRYAGATVSASDKWGKTPLHLAAEAGSLAVLEALMKPAVKNSDLEIRQQEDLFTCLHTAASCGHPPLIAVLIDAGADPLARTEFGDTTLHLAAENGGDNVVRYLLENNIVDVNVENHNGSTPLHRAASRGRFHVVKTLIRFGASGVDLKNHAGERPIDLAKKRSHKDVVAILEIAMIEKAQVDRS